MVAPADPHPAPVEHADPGQPDAAGRPERSGRPEPPGRPDRPDPREESDRPEHPPGEDVDPYCLSPGEADRLLVGSPWRRFAVLGDGPRRGAGRPRPRL